MLPHSFPPPLISTPLSTPFFVDYLTMLDGFGPESVSIGEDSKTEKLHLDNYRLVLRLIVQSRRFVRCPASPFFHSSSTFLVLLPTSSFISRVLIIVH